MVMIFTPKEITDKAFEAVVKAGKLNVPCQGIAFVTEVKAVAGIFTTEDIPSLAMG